jgi:3-oxoacyl-[acyl-carrier-protein] synthase-3
MGQMHSVITGIAGYLPDYVLNNEELSHMVDTNDEWIMTRVGIKERRILNEEGLGSSYLGRKAVNALLAKTGVDPESIDALIVPTTTPDYHFPSTGAIIAEKCGLTNALAFDMEAACAGFIYGLEVADGFIHAGRCKKVIVVCAEKLSCMVDYSDRATCPLFGDGAAAVLLEPTTEELGLMDSYLRVDGKGLPFLHMKAGGSVCPPSHFTVDHHMHYIYQEGRTVFRYAVTSMASSCEEVMKRNGLAKDDIKWIIPHQANIRIIEAVAKRLEFPTERVMVNIEHYGNTSGCTIPLAMLDFESQLKKGDRILLTAFGAGFTFGATYIIWGYDGATAAAPVK